MSFLAASAPAAAVVLVAAFVARLPPVAATAPWGPAVVLASAAFAALALLSCTVRFLGKDEQLRVEGFTETTVLNGPGIQFLNPFGYRHAVRVKAEMLDTLDWQKVKDTLTGEERIERGPKLLFLGPYERVAQKGQGITLSKTEYLQVEDQLTGSKSMVKGPGVRFPMGPHEVLSAKKTAIVLQEDEFTRIRDEATGQRWVQQGKLLLFLESTWRADGVKKAWTLKAFEYVRLLDSVTGKVTVHRGEKTVFPGPNEELLDGDKLAALDLKVDEYVKLEDQNNGQIRVVAGPAQVFLGPNERALQGGKKRAVQVDDETAVLVRDTSTGQQRLVTAKQLFVPGPTEAIEEVRSLIKLADHEAMIVKDKGGQYHFHYGSPEKQSAEHPRSFFLPPYAEAVKLYWSSGLRREKRDLVIERFDCRPQYMWFEFDCRTSDNVELILEVTMFWQVMDLAKLIRSTGNLPGDIYNQARSQFIKNVAQVTLKVFMDDLHSISRKVHEEDTAFYDSRGVQIQTLDVTRYKCSEQRTSEVLQQIIEETTNRLNRLSKAESANEVKMFTMQGEIEQEKLNAELLAITQRHAQSEARVAGAAEAERVSAFMAGLEKDVPKLEDRVTMWQVLRKQDALSVVSEGGGNLYYTPNDVDLSIRTDGGGACSGASARGSRGGGAANGRAAGEPREAEA